MRLRLARILLLLSVIGTCKSACVPAHAQGSIPLAMKVAELNDEYYEMYCSVLDTFIEKLKQNNALHGVIIVYGPEGNLIGTRDGISEEVKHYLNGVGVSPDRLTIIKGEISQRPPWTTTEMWIVPPGAKMPEAVKRPVPTTDFSGKVGHMIGAENDGDVELDFPSSYGSAMAAFSQILRRQPNSIGYLIVHQDLDDPFENWRRMGKYGVKILKIHGADLARVKIIHGKAGHHYPIDDLWILSKGEHLPATN